MGCFFMTWIFYGVCVGLLYALYLFISQRNEENKLQRWSQTPKDLVILHGFPGSKHIPSPSPFIFKVETFLRMAKIPYEIDTKDVLGPKGKAPWISINGQHIPDSEFIIEFLKKKFEKNFDGNYSEEQLAVATAVRIMLDEHFFWGMAMERLVYGFQHFERVIKLPMLFIVKYVLRYFTIKNSKAQGIGRHSEEEVVKIMTKDLRVVSTILGNKKFICGDEPCEQDCGIFSFLAQCVWCLHESPYEKLVNGELKNLKEYSIRMKEKYWADWEDRLEKY